MPYKGHVENGVIVLDDSVTLEEGAVVAVEVTGRRSATTESPGQSRCEFYQPFIGALDGLPQDWAENHDAYLRERHSS